MFAQYNFKAPDELQAVEAKSVKKNIAQNEEFFTPSATVVLPWNEGDDNLKQQKRYLLECSEIKIQVIKFED